MRGHTLRIDAHIPRPRKPVDVAPEGYGFDWCTCGHRVWGTDRIDFAANWYGHLLKMLDVDPDGDHALPGACAMTAITSPFDEKRLRADIVSMWGAHGAHADVFDFMLAEIEALRTAVRLAQEGWYVTDEPALIEVDTFGSVTDEWSHPALRRAVENGREVQS